MKEIKTLFVDVHVEVARKFNVNTVDCSSVLGSHVLVVLFVCVFFL